MNARFVVHTSMLLIALLAAVVPMRHSLFAQALDLSPAAGDWEGALNAGGAVLRIVFHIKSDENGALTATMDSPDQGASGIPVTTVTLEGDQLTIDMPAIGGRYVGTLDEAQTTADGNWSQGGMTLSLKLEKTDRPTEINRPQEPRQPYPYEEEEVFFPNDDAGIRLAGTLTRPAGDGPFPAAVLISGSGHPDNACLILPGLNHLFQTANTGSPTEYGRIEETFAPRALTTISDWIAERVHLP